MKNTILFAIDGATKETLVSESEKASNKVIFIERIGYNENELLYDTVALLTKIANATPLNVPVYIALDKVCQLIYSNHTKSK